MVFSELVIEVGELLLLVVKALMAPRLKTGKNSMVNAKGKVKIELKFRRRNGHRAQVLANCEWHFVLDREGPV